MCSAAKLQELNAGHVALDLGQVSSRGNLHIIIT
jgi:hypothetical protein